MGIYQDVLPKGLVEDHIGLAHRFHQRLQQYINGQASMSYYSPLHVENDQKELIINQLKNEVFYLRKNEQDYMFLEDQYKKLQQRYRILSEEKMAGDGDFRARHEQAIRNIGQLKNEVDALKAELRNLNLELSDLDADGNTLKTQLDQRNIEIERLKTDINSLLADSEELLNERARLDGQAEMLKADKLKLLGELKNLQCDNDSVSRKLSDIERYLSSLDGEGKSLRDKILQYENDNNALDDSLQDAERDLDGLQRAINEAQKQVKDLQASIASLLATNNKHKSEAAHFQKAIQTEIIRNTDIGKSLAQAENTLRVRDSQILAATKEVKNLDFENGSLTDLNRQLEDDLEACQKHIENLALLNAQLLAELQRYSAEDETVRVLLDRRPRILRARARVDETVTISRTTAPAESRSVLRSKLAY